MKYGLKGLGMSGQVHNKTNNLIFDYLKKIVKIFTIDAYIAYPMIYLTNIKNN